MCLFVCALVGKRSLPLLLLLFLRAAIARLFLLSTMSFYFTKVESESEDKQRREM